MFDLCQVVSKHWPINPVAGFTSTSILPHTKEVQSPILGYGSKIEYPQKDWLTIPLPPARNPGFVPCKSIHELGYKSTATARLGDRIENYRKIWGFVTRVTKFVVPRVGSIPSKNQTPSLLQRTASYKQRPQLGGFMCCFLDGNRILGYKFVIFTRWKTLPCYLWWTFSMFDQFLAYHIPIVAAGQACSESPSMANLRYLGQANLSES